MKTGAFYQSNDATRPGLGSKTVIPSDTAEVYEGEYARLLVVFSAGTVCFIGADGVSDTWTFAATVSFPTAIPVACSKVMSTGTTVTAGDIKAVR